VRLASAVLAFRAKIYDSLEARFFICRAEQDAGMLEYFKDGGFLNGSKLSIF